jgi:hypothetical protein
MTLLLGTCFLFSYSTIREHETKTNINSTSNPLRISYPDSLFHSGDLIFRDGRGIISSTFRKLSLTDPKYSHAGIIHRENGKIFVYHMIGGEENKTNKMRKDLLSDFCCPIQSNAFGVYRTDQNENEIDSLAGYYFSNHLEFDTHFDLTTDDKMYCTELIYKILKKVSGQDNFLPLSVLSGVNYEACDNIYLSSHSKKIYSSDNSIKPVK